MPHVYDLSREACRRHMDPGVLERFFRVQADPNRKPGDEFEVE